MPICYVSSTHWYILPFGRQAPTIPYVARTNFRSIKSSFKVARGNPHLISSDEFSALYFLFRLKSFKCNPRSFSCYHNFHVGRIFLRDFLEVLEIVEISLRFKLSHSPIGRRHLRNKSQGVMSLEDSQQGFKAIDLHFE
uniref:ULP_PROTEASE domain-containing protein n=1 Tax=Ascaris lumbricoides TaxID=6252 RepID=A0A0M3IAL7_ASCLU